MKQSIAKRLSIRVAAAFAIAFLLLTGGAFITLKRNVKMEVARYGRSLAGIFADLVIYDANTSGVPIDTSFSEQISFFGDYMCTWYRTDYTFAYVPDIEKGTITYISASKKDNDGEISDDHWVGKVEEYTLTENELAVWNGTSIFSVEQSDWSDECTDISVAIDDSFGNRSMIGISVSSDKLLKDMMSGFLVAYAFMFVIVVLLALLVYLLIKRMVTRPARYISEVMSDYIARSEKSSVKLEYEGDNEFSMIAEAFNRMTEDIDKYINDIARFGRERERARAEVDIASGIQMGFLPFGSAILSNCRIEAMMKPAKDVGGDLYNYLELDPTHTMAVIADVSGKGIPSAILMTVILTHIRQSARIGVGPGEILRSVNDTFSKKNPKLMFVTAFVGIYDSEAGTLTYANAGHNPPYLLKDRPVLLDKASGTPLGLFPGDIFEEATVEMEEGDALFLYTDGVNEAVNAAGEFFGTERLEKVLAKVARSKAAHIMETVKASLREFTSGAYQNDDITMLVLEAGKNRDLELDYDPEEFKAIRERLLSSGLPEQMKKELCVAAEECFVNICSYAFSGPAPEGEKILFHFDCDEDHAVLRFSDGGRPFDPRTDLPDTEEYDIDTAVGGLGRLIAFTIADSVDYEYLDGRNILTITKSIKS